MRVKPVSASINSISINKLKEKTSILLYLGNYQVFYLAFNNIVKNPLAGHKINDFLKAHLPRIHEDIFNLKKYIDYFKKQIEQTEIQEIDDGNEENQPNSLQITKENISEW